MKSPSARSQFQVIEELVAASKEGRTLVPLVGAGISIESGIPALSALTQYLAKVQHYIRQGLYDPARKGPGAGTGSGGDGDPMDRRDYRKDPSLFLKDFGWPDPNQLDANLWERIKPIPGVDDRRLLDHKIEEELIQDIERFDKDLAGKIRLLTGLRTRFSGSAPEELKSLLETGLWNLKGNWKTLLAYLTRANPDYVDTLFHQLVKRRHPGTSHRFMAFLAPLLGIRLILTTNFDNLLEEALRLEGFRPFVYEVSKDSLLPHHALMQGELSVVKLHGGAFGLRVGESLDYPLDENSRQRLKGYLPPRSVLLVMGLGGWDRRITDLVELVAEHNHPGSGRDIETSIYWLHFEPDCPGPVEELVKSTGGAVCTARVQDPGAFLVDLYSRLTGSHPPSAHPYSPQILRPIDPQSPPCRPLAEKSIYFVREEEGDYSLGSSLALAHLAAAKAGTHIPIWVDLEAMATVTDAVVEIFRQLRKYDPALSPIVLPAGQALDDIARFDKPVRRIFDALRRGRYLLAFNAALSFGRPPTFHHGVPERSGERPHPGTRFLLDLIQAATRGVGSARPLKDSILAFGVDVPRLRSRKAKRPNGRNFIEDLQRDHPDLVEILPSQGARRERPERVAPELAEALLLLAAFRRRRSMVALMRLLPKYLPEASGLRSGERWKRIGEFLEEVQSKGYLLKVEGGSLWMGRRLRDEIYGEEQSATNSEALSQQSDPAAQGWLALRQLARLVSIHEDIAEYYHSNMYVASLDLSALLEHVYHRISALRYLTKLQWWLARHKNPPIPAELWRAVRQCLKNSAGVDDQGFVRTDILRKLRHVRLQSIRQIFDRERERLLSGVSADTLVGWVDWIQKQDIPRFRTDLCLKPEVKGDRARWAIFLKTSEERESEIAEECARLWYELDDLKAIAFRDRGDFLQCINLRTGQIRWMIEAPLSGKALGQTLPRHISIPTGWPWLQQAGPVLQEFADVCPPEERRRLVRFLCDIWTCLRGANNSENRKRAEVVQELVRRIVESPGQPPGSKRDEYDESVVLLKRHSADHLAMSLNPWETRGTNLAMNRTMEIRCRDILSLCDEGLIHLERGGGVEYRRHRSYLHSLKGRALYLLGRHVDAHGELDLSQSGLGPSVGADREVLSVSLLRLAECLLVRADQTVLESCFDAWEAQGRSHHDLGALSAEGRLFVVWNQIQTEWTRTLKAEPNPGTHWRLRFAMALWLRQGGGGEPGSSPDPGDAYHRLKTDWGLGPALDAWESKWTPKEINLLLEQEAGNGQWQETLRKVHRLSMSHWPQEIWKTLDVQDLQAAVRRSEELLARAEEVLDRAEIMLAEARRNVEWWACLYQLRAQLHTDRLLLQITAFWSRQERLGDQKKPHFIARFVNDLEAGLRAIRQGFDVVLPVGLLGERDKEGLLAGFHGRTLRVSRFVRMWIQLMVCGAYLTRQAKEAEAPGEPRIPWDPLWGRWKSMCEFAGFNKLLSSPEFFRAYDLATEPALGYSGGPGGRSFTLSSIKGCIRAGARTLLIDNLAQPVDSRARRRRRPGT